jgi:uncharacterized protein (TIGR00369 family)
MESSTAAESSDRLAHARARWDSHPLHHYFGISLELLGHGYARCRMRNNAHNRGGVHGAAHGGVLAFLCDVAALAAISTVVSSGERASGTAELNISYLSPGTGDVLAEARVLRKGRTLAVADIELKDDAGKLLAKSRVSYALHPPELAQPSPVDGRSVAP